MRHENKAELAKNVNRLSFSRAHRYGRQFKLSDRARKNLTWLMMDRLDGCADDSARRIILGISEQFEAADRKAGTGRLELS